MISFTSKGIYCVPGKFYLDPWQPVDLAVISHGHADHAHWGMKKYLCHHFTVNILRSRIGPDIQVQGLSYNEAVYINGVRVSLHPAGHIIGSAQIRLEHKGKVVVFTGDYKIQDDGLSSPFEPIKCHELITESTFGLPIYRWDSVEAQNESLQTWIKTNQSNNKTSVFIGYSLGKSQRILNAVHEMGPVYVHYSIAKLNEAYSQAGIKLPNYRIADLKSELKQLDNQIVLLPPALLDSQLLQKIPHVAHAICSGWMQIRGARRWRSADAGFAISDHADWQGLLQAVRGSAAEKVYVTHGQTATFAKYLNEIGIEAEEVKTQYGDEEDPQSQTTE
ncbi:ligase-associated DNA damage response exonuclease [Sphingobacterium multivorum]|uniref:F0F1-type ATP synthase, epsilon subunit (Mitochondrial delta subunit) n=1 Tax=Sphingobacterium multivorum TaxID=28454 RepID=A0A2X2IU06_SPHMU|nr:ligase-associated DNA damage response exonuclease [Sphingobacterium multivorum]QRQ63694.1 ligase-associated DNA damage response exonuclease [Sphingobacterium multivorum]SPZ85727.1 F0F1-type ATP synthase, epsilon subunit (mitochondrial delta subunit) [Sphingobacterium multivorum]